MELFALLPARTIERNRGREKKRERIKSDLESAEAGDYLYVKQINFFAFAVFGQARISFILASLPSYFGKQRSHHAELMEGS